MKRKQVYLPERQIEQIKKSSKKEGLSFSEMLRRIVSAFFEK